MGSSKQKLPKFAWPGGYQINYVDPGCSVFCAECAEKIGGVLTSDIHWEGPALSCDECGVQLDSEYGDTTEEQSK